MQSAPMYGAEEIGTFVGFAVLMLAASELGFRLGRRYPARSMEASDSQISTIEAAVLGVLGLLLAFTMSMAVNRFETRKQLVLQEANAIGTAHLRTQLLPEPQSSEIAGLLREYVDTRVEAATETDDEAGLAAARRNSVRLQDQFWRRAVAYAQTDPNPVRAGLLLQSLNEVIDLDAARWMAYHDHVPAAVIYIIALVALLASIIMGYSFSTAGQRQVFSQIMLTLAVTIVLALVVDLDLPRRGLIHVTQQPMIDLQRSLHP